MNIELHFRITELSRYIDILEKSLKENLDEFNKTSEEELNAYANHPDFEVIREGIIDEHWRLIEVYPNILRKSILTTCYSFLEFELKKICKDQKERKSLQLDETDLNGKGIERSKNYLKKVVKINFPDEIWNEISHINKIRNIIVHKDGIVDAKDSIREYIKGRSDISISDVGNSIILDANSIILDANYCRYVVNIIKTFLEELYRLTHEYPK